MLNYIAKHIFFNESIIFNANLILIQLPRPNQYCLDNNVVIQTDTTDTINNESNGHHYSTGQRKVRKIWHMCSK